MEFKNVSEDERRTIYANNKLLNGKEISVITLHRGKACGGCIHSKDEYYCILKGLVTVMKGDKVFVEKVPSSGTFTKGTPHGFYALEESIIIEFGISPDEKKRNIKNKEMLEKIDKLNKT